MGLQEIQLQSFVLTREDLAEFLPDATDNEFTIIADLLADYLMEEWADCLQHACSIVEGDRRTAGKG